MDDVLSKYPIVNNLGRVQQALPVVGGGNPSSLLSTEGVDEGTFRTAPPLICMSLQVHVIRIRPFIRCTEKVHQFWGKIFARIVWKLRKIVVSLHSN